MTHSRRRFLEYLAASPLLPAQTAAEFIPSKPEEAINILDFEAAARRKLPAAHFGYIATGVEDDYTLQANREAFRHFQLRPRRLRDVTQVSTRVNIHGRDWDAPLLLAPTGSHRAFHDDGELGVARAARSRKTLQILSTASTTSVEDVNAAVGEPVWYQLYATTRWTITEALVKRAEAAGCPVLVVTVDIPTGRKTETEIRYRMRDSRDCRACHPNGGLGTPGYFIRKPMFQGIDMTNDNLFAPALTWDSIARIKRMTSMKVVLKGIVTREDAVLSRETGIDGVIVSNHGGRAEESGRGSIDCLPEVVEGVQGAMPVFIDGGFRRGTDIFKALALGARAVCIGRPYLWGLGAFGQAGVEAVIDMLRKELTLVMQQCGARNIAEIQPALVRNVG
jgi:isopentenyl diphosphate isomerase/L-lactate dehydrogenase-like FMN-dependent dehydrogenase